MLGTRLEATLERTPVQHQVVPEHDTPLGNSAGEHIDQPVRPTLDERLKSRSRSTTAAIPDGRRDNAVPQHAQEHASSSAEAVRRPAGARDLEPAAAATADADGLRSFRIALALNARRFRSQLTVESGSVGTTQIRVSIGENGLTRDVAITHSSGDNALDREAQTLLTQAARATMLPETLRGVDFSVDLSVVFDAH